MATDKVIPSAVGDIHVPDTGRQNNTIDTSFEFTPQNPFTMDIPNKDGETLDSVGNPGFPVEPDKVGFFKSAVNEFEELATNYHIAHRANAPLAEPAGMQVQYFIPDVNDKFYHPAPAGWSPKQEIEKLSDNVDPKFITKLMNTKNPDDFKYQMDSINEESIRSKELQNGSTLGKILGGSIGLTVGSIENFIPLVSIATKAKVASGFVSGLTKNIPGILGASAIREGAAEMDKVDGNLPDFLKDTFIDAAFGTVFFGGIGAAKSLVNVSEFNRLKQFSRDFLDGIGFNYKVDKEGNHVGFEAVDTTGGSVSAAKVTRAQERADAAFYKGGLFKVPYVGTAVLKTISGNFSNDVPGFRTIGRAAEYLLGSPLVKLKISDYKSANAFADAAFDHFITTEGEAKGGIRPKSFEKKVKETKAMLTALGMQTDALHAERNGYTIKVRPAIAIQNAWSAAKQKSIETLSKESKSTDWVSKEDFMDEVQKVMYSGETSEHASVNNAASLYRKVFDTTGLDYLKAHNLPKDYFRNMDKYLSRVYNIPYLNDNEKNIYKDKDTGFVPVIANWYKEADGIISQKMQPIHDLEYQIKDFKSAHDIAFEELGRRQLQLHPGRDITYPNEEGVSIRNYLDEIPKGSKKNRGNANRETPLLPYQDIFETYSNMREKLKNMKEKLQNELRENPEYDYHVDDRNALSANEAKELQGILKPLNEIQKQIDDQELVVSTLEKNKSKALEVAKKQKTVEKAKPYAAEHAVQQEQIDAEKAKLHDLKINHSDEKYNLYDKARSGEINPRLYNPLTFEFRNPNDRLKFRPIFNSHEEREIFAKSAYDSIMQMHPEDIIADMFGKITGSAESNPLKARTLLVPDELLYNNNFLTKDLYAKTANYVNFLSRRTHLKTSFDNVTVSGDFKELAANLVEESEAKRDRIHQNIEKTNDPKEIKRLQKLLKDEKRDFNDIKSTMKTLFENRMMGINKRSNFDNMARRTAMSLTAAANLHNLGATQITDLAFAGFQHGIWPSIRDGIYPFIESLGGILKTKDAEALRRMAPHINLGLQDHLNNMVDRNSHSELQPFANMGKIVSGIEKFAHFSALTDLTPYIDNNIQRVNGSIIQSNFMELLHNYTEGTLTKKDSLYLRKYGIDPKEWAERMTKAYKEAGGFKTKLGGYMSKSWLWQDLEAANVFNDAVFRGIQNTLVTRGMADSPFFADHVLGMFFHTFSGWTYAATNRYLIPALQHPDGAMLLKMMWMLGAGALVSPMRRISRGEDAVPDDMTNEQRAYEAFSDSGVISSISNVLNIANFMTDDKLLGDLKNDKFKNRVKTGIFGMSDVVSSTASRISDVLGMVNSGLDEKDLKTAARMLPITGAMYGHYFSDKLIESWNLPRNKRAAQLDNG